MSDQKLVVPGFGVGSFYGTAISRPLDSTSTLTLTGTVLPAGSYAVVNMITGNALVYYSTTNGVTATYTVATGAAPAMINYDGASGKLTSTTTSATILFIGT